MSVIHQPTNVLELDPTDDVANATVIVMHGGRAKRLPPGALADHALDQIQPELDAATTAASTATATAADVVARQADIEEKIANNVPEHVWVDGTKLALRNPDGSLGAPVELAGPADLNNLAGHIAAMIGTERDALAVAILQMLGIPFTVGTPRGLLLLVTDGRPKPIL